MNIQTDSVRNLFRIIAIVALLALTPALHAADKLKALIMDGQNAFHPPCPVSASNSHLMLEVFYINSPMIQTRMTPPGGGSARLNPN
jgi:hypothetical protein